MRGLIDLVDDELALVLNAPKATIIALRGTCRAMAARLSKRAMELEQTALAAFAARCHGQWICNSIRLIELDRVSTRCINDLDVHDFRLLLHVRTSTSAAASALRDGCDDSWRRAIQDIKLSPAKPKGVAVVVKPRYYIYGPCSTQEPIPLEQTREQFAVFLRGVAAGTFSELSKLELDGVQMGNEGLRSLLAAGPSLNQLTDVNLSDNRISGAAGFGTLGSALPRLERLAMNNNPLGDAALVEFVDALPPLQGLKRLELRDVGMGDGFVRALAGRAFADVTRRVAPTTKLLPTLTELDVRNNRALGGASTLLLGGLLISSQALGGLVCLRMGGLRFNQPHWTPVHSCPPTTSPFVWYGTRLVVWFASLLSLRGFAINPVHDSRGWPYGCGTGRDLLDLAYGHSDQALRENAGFPCCVSNPAPGYAAFNYNFPNGWQANYHLGSSQFPYGWQDIQFELDPHGFQYADPDFLL